MGFPTLGTSIPINRNIWLDIGRSIFLIQGKKTTYLITNLNYPSFTIYFKVFTHFLHKIQQKMSITFILARLANTSWRWTLGLDETLHCVCANTCWRYRWVCDHSHKANIFQCYGHQFCILGDHLRGLFDVFNYPCMVFPVPIFG